ncbi:Protein BCP1 [Ceratocystis lukuohia]|uniref:Protein BCP1 n=3 Tax=Ceratocystis TaxID=5157 RepID=A0A0F8B0C1_CERFI|nr:Protein BCP1 [Ceratocystis platani]PHH55516.1 Protein BCP1 [Ceratocystis fimbriata CBS 114723]
MGKKRSHEASSKDEPIASHDTKMKDNDESSDDEDFDIVNVDFEWFNFDSEIDYHGTKSLLRQLFDVDAVLQDISGLADLILTQNTIGSTVKVDGKSADPYAMMTALNAHEHAAKAPMASLVTYLSEKAGTNAALAPVVSLLSPTSGAQVAIVFSERLVNMPAEIAPPMYSMLIDEVEAAVEDGEPYKFTHYLVVSKVYSEVESTLVEAERKKKKAKEDTGAFFFFHPEDEVLQKHALAHGSFNFTKEEDSVADSKRAFQEMGIKTRGHMILIEAAKFPGAVQAAEAYVKSQ